MLRSLECRPLSELDASVFAATMPEDHYLRRVKEVIDFERFRSQLVCAYDQQHGRPAVEPLLLLKLEFLSYHYNLSDRQVIAESRYNMAFRWFLDLSLDSALPHHTLLTYFRERLGVERHQQIFDDLVGQAREKGLVKDRLRLKDATHVLANIAIPSTIVLVSQTRERLLKALRPWAAERVAQEEQRVKELRTVTADLSGEERLLQRVRHLQSVVAWAEELLSDPAWTLSSLAAQEPLRKALALARKVLADREDPEGTDRLLSLEDEEARRSMHCVYYVGYLLDVAMDADSQIVTALNVVSPNGQEAADTVTLLQREEQAHGNDIEAVSMDRAGFQGEVLHTLTDPQGLNVEVYVPPKAEPATEYFKPEQFTLDETAEKLTCPAGQTTTTRRRSWKDGGWSFRFKRSTCAGCPLQAQCMAKLPQSSGRVVVKNDYEKEYQAARAKAGTAAYKAVRREHPAIERKLGELVRWHRARRARYRGRMRVLLQGLLTGLVVNIKRIVAMVTNPDAGGRGIVRAELATGT